MADDPNIGQDAREDATSAKIVQDGGRQGVAPNSPIDTENPHPEGPSDVAGHEAAQRAAGDAPEETPGSQ